MRKVKTLYVSLKVEWNFQQIRKQMRKVKMWHVRVSFGTMHVKRCFEGSALHAEIIILARNVKPNETMVLYEYQMSS